MNPDPNPASSDSAVDEKSPSPPSSILSSPPPRSRRETKTRTDLGWDKLLAELAARTHTARGNREALALTPSLDVGYIRSRLAEVSEARALSDRGEPMPFGAIFDVEPHLARAEKGGHLDGLSLREVAGTLTAGRILRRHLASRGPLSSSSNSSTPRLAGRAALIAELADVADPIADAFDDLGQLLDSASMALGSLRRKAAHLRDELDKRSHALLDHPLIAPHLQDRFYTRRDDRFVLPIRTDARTRVKGIVHGSSGSGQTVFVEPEEIVDLNNRLKLAELEVSDEERRILGELTLLVADAVRPIRANLEILAELDLIDASARLGTDLRATEPEVLATNDDASDKRARIDLRRARHPLMSLSGREVIPNDIALALGGTLVISGPNAGGKTVALKTCGLLVLMARAGLHLPVQEGSSLALFDTVLTDVGDDQSIERNLSTFSAHVANLNEFLVAAGPRTLILLDEIAVGTDPDQGAALAEAVLCALAEKRATVIVTTHYERLKALGAGDPRFANASVGFDMTTLSPTYELHLGVPGASGAIVVARRLGLPEAIAAHAEQLLDGKTQKIEALLNQVETERRKLMEGMRAAEEERRAAREERTRAEELSAEAEARLKAARKGQHDEAVEALKGARVELDRLRASLKKASVSSRADLAQADQAIDRAAQEMKKHAPPAAGLAGRAATADDLFVGAEVLVPRIGGRGVVMSAPKGGKVAVQVGALKLTVDESELLVPHAASHKTNAASHKPAVQASFASGGATAAPTAIRTSDNTMDLRGERVDAALAMAEKFLDDALRAGLELVYFVHGHGTGALRNALRAHLKIVPGVASVRPGDGPEGGDGVTVAVLDS